MLSDNIILSAIMLSDNIRLLLGDNMMLSDGMLSFFKLHILYNLMLCLQWLVKMA
jgi:hypothetical protein